MSVVDTFRQAVAQFGDRVRSTRQDQWQAGTPCSEWDVRALVNHVTGELRWIPPLLQGRTIAEVGTELDGDLLGDDPAFSWEAAADAAIASMLDAGALERTVHLSFGDHPAAAYIAEVTTDVVIHTWDLAKATGGATRLHPDLVAFATATLEPQIDGWRSGGALGPAVDAPADADEQARFLAWVGRSPA